MSQASNQVKWCIGKAKKEIEECKKLGKRLKHRGLLKIKPNIDQAKGHIEKAEHNLKVLLVNKEHKFYDWAINIGFYVIYQCFLAIAAKFGYESRNQTCTISLIEWLKEEGKIEIDTQFINMLKTEDTKEQQEKKVIEMREEYTYGTEISIEDETKIDELLSNCKEMIDIAKKIIFN